MKNWKKNWSILAILLLALVVNGCHKSGDDDTSSPPIPPKLTGIVISGPAQLNESSTAQYKVTGEYDNGQEKDVTNEVSWELDKNCATIVNGLLIASTIDGNTIVCLTATFESQRKSVYVTIINLTAQTLVGLTITGPTVVPEKSSANFSAIAISNDGSVKDVSSSSTWYISSVYGNFDTKGTLITKEMNGDQTTIIQVSYTKDGVTKTATTSITISDLPVSQPTLTGLNITGATSISEGTSMSYTAKASLSNGDIIDVTGSAGWGISNIGVATVNNSGIVIANNVISDQVVRITATYVYNGISKSASFDVTIVNIVPPPIPTSLTITGSSSVNELTATAYTITLNFSDGSKKDVTNVAIAIVNNTDYASISKGVLTILDIPYNLLCTIRASHTEGSVTLSATLQVTAINKVPTVKYKVACVNFDIENPYGENVTNKQIRDQLGKIAPYSVAVSTSHCSNGYKDFARIAREFQLKVYLGVNLVSDDAMNQSEIADAVAAVNLGYVDRLVLGKNVLSKGILTEDQLITYINQVKTAVPSTPVAVDEVGTEWPKRPNVIAACDIVSPNFDPFKDGRYIDLAIAYIDFSYHDVVKAAGTKPVVISSIGWPSSGDQIGDAIASPENAALFFLNLFSWAKAGGVSVCYRETNDEAWKGVGENSYGILDEYGELKTGTERVFNNESMADNWSFKLIPGGSGMPIVNFTHIPTYDTGENLYGEVLHVLPSDYRIVIYIYVRGTWWIKPYWNNYITGINTFGEWGNRVYTGGYDYQATGYCAYLIPVTYSGGYDMGSLDAGCTYKAVYYRP